jgi:hypothetical protein
MNINAGEHGAQIVDGSLEVRVVRRDVVFGHTLDDDCEQLIVSQLTAFAVAEFADKSPEVHRERSVVDQFL